MKCKEFKKIIEEFMEGKTVNDENALRHMRECPVCAREFNIIKKMKTAFNEKEKVNIPSDFNDVVWLRLKEQPPMTWQRAIKSIFMRPLVPQATAVVLAAILILIFAVKFNTNIKIQKLARAVKPAFTASENKIAALQTAVQAKKEEVAAKVKQIAVSEKPVQTKKQEMAGNNTIQPNHAVVAQNEANQAEPHMALPAQGKEAAVSAAKQPEQAAENVNAASAPIIKATSTATAEVTKENLQIKNNVINPEKGESVTIQYKVSQQAEILIRVYDRMGETIKTIESGPKQQGTYDDFWKGDDDTGALVSAGIYVIYIKTDLVDAKRKVCIVK